MASIPRGVCRFYPTPPEVFVLEQFGDELLELGVDAEGEGTFLLCLVLVAVVACGMLAALAMEPTEASTRADASGEAKLRDALHLERI